MLDAFPQAAMNDGRLSAFGYEWAKPDRLRQYGAGVGREVRHIVNNISPMGIKPSVAGFLDEDSTPEILLTSQR